MDTPRLIQVCSLAELQSARSAKFLIKGERFDRDGMVIWHDGQPFAYFNECPHLGITLDFDDNEFFSSDHRELVCKNHGALFVPTTGECTAGPCKGTSLKHLPVSIVHEHVVVEIK